MTQPLTPAAEATIVDLKQATYRRELRRSIQSLEDVARRIETLSDRAQRKRYKHTGLSAAIVRGNAHRTQLILDLYLDGQPS